MRDGKLEFANNYVQTQFADWYFSWRGGRSRHYVDWFWKVQGLRVKLSFIFKRRQERHIVDREAKSCSYSL
jgi:hypothetical protein